MDQTPPAASPPPGGHRIAPHIAEWTARPTDQQTMRSSGNGDQARTDAAARALAADRASLAQFSQQYAKFGTALAQYQKERQYGEATSPFPKFDKPS